MGQTVSSDRRSDPSAALTLDEASSQLFGLIEADDTKEVSLTIRLQLFNDTFSVQQVASCRNASGLTLLHAAVALGRVHLLSSFFKAGHWTVLIGKRVNKKSRTGYARLTAHQIAAARRSPSEKLVKELDRLSSWEKSLNPCHVAAREGNIRQVDRIHNSESRHQLYEVDAMDCSTLFWACVNGNVKLVRQLVTWGVNYKAVNKLGETLLHVACELDHYGLVRYIGQRLEINPLAKDVRGLTPIALIDNVSLTQLLSCRLPTEVLGHILNVAAATGNVQVIRYLVDEFNVDLWTTDKFGLNALMSAVFSGQDVVVRYLLTHPVDWTAVGLRGRNVLHVAAASTRCDMTMVRTLLDNMPRRQIAELVNTRDRYYVYDSCRRAKHANDICIYVEVHRGLMSAFERLLRNSVDEVDLDQFGLTWKCPGDPGAVSKRLQAESMSLLCKHPESDMTPLHVAVLASPTRGTDFVGVFLTHGADPNVGDFFGLTPLHLAAMLGDLAILEMLLFRGADTRSFDSRGKTAVDVARDNGHAEVVAFLEDVSRMPLEQAILRVDVLPNGSVFQCPICFEDIEPPLGVGLRLCRHQFCRKCLASYISAIQTPRIDCPLHSEGCNKVLLHREIRRLVDGRTYDRLVQLSITEGELAAGQTSRHCKTKDCPFWVFFDATPECLRGSNCKFTCEVCLKVNCVACDVIHDRGQSCAEYRKQQQLQQQRDTAANVQTIEAMINRREAMKCPSCQQAIVKNGGCNHMTCRCRREFTWTGT